MNIIGISCFYHDASAVLLQDGKLVAAAAEERFSRIKHDFGFPEKSIDFCLSSAGLTSDDIDYIIFYEKPFLKFQRILLTCLNTFPCSRKFFHKSMILWLKDKLWLKELIAEKTGISRDKLLFCRHHTSHAASAFLCSPFKEAAILTVDGAGEWATTTFGYGRDNKVYVEKEIRFPHSIGLLYSTFTAFLGFKVNEGEYKVMGMASYGTPKYVAKINKLISIDDDGSFKLDMRYFAYHYSTERSYSKKFIKEFGKPNTPENSGQLDQYYADIAASIQKVTEEVMVKLCNALYKLHPMPKLCLAGGVALNCVANAKILEHTPFEEVYIQPSAGDGGGALGAALYTYNHVLNNERSFFMNHAYWGQEPGKKVSESIKKTTPTPFSNEDDMIKAVALKLSEGKVVGWVHGRSEWGPRALGNRSILADPRNPKMKDIINSKIKFREPFRPFAPAVISDKAQEYFDIAGINHYPYKFMLYTAKVKNDKQSTIPAVTHVDGTARLQIVDEKTNPLFYKLIKEFYNITKVPVLLNTSFNLKDEPIVDTFEDALKTFYRSDIDLLASGNQIIYKQKVVQ